LFNLSWMISKTLASCGNTEILRESLIVHLIRLVHFRHWSDQCMFI
jgi:hypothetical protein